MACLPRTTSPWLTWRWCCRTIADLNTAIADITNASIENADINWANIKDLTTGTAIIERGINGQLYVADLVVTEANIASLTVGELVVKGADSSFYTISIDESGTVTTIKKEVTGGDIADESLPGGKLMLNTSFVIRRFLPSRRSKTAMCIH